MPVFEFYRVALDAHNSPAEVRGNIFEHEIVHSFDDGQLDLRCPAVEIGQHIGAVAVVVIGHLPRLATEPPTQSFPRGRVLGQCVSARAQGAG